jgi:hypothetical protein
MILCFSLGIKRIRTWRRICKLQLVGLWNIKIGIWWSSSDILIYLLVILINNLAYKSFFRENI